MSEKLNIAVCQMTSIDDVETNFHQIEKLISQIREPADIAFFPENCLYLRLIEGQSIPGMTLEEPALKKLSLLAKQRQLALHLGSVPLKQNGKLTNATVFIDKTGHIQCSYEKMHLFDIELTGQKPIRESDAFSHGPQPSIQVVDDWKFGQSICYDLRFAELFSHYAKIQVDAILVPAAFLVPTGKAHWEVLLRARAIESQCYVIAAAQAGIHRSHESHSQQGSRSTFGHSLIVSPWGEILAEGSADKPEVLEFCLEKPVIETVRRQIPMKSHRRL